MKKSSILFTRMLINQNEQIKSILQSVSIWVFEIWAITKGFERNNRERRMNNCEFRIDAADKRRILVRPQNNK